MELTRNNVNGVAVVEVAGKLIGGLQSTDQFHKLFRSLLDDGDTKVIVNLSDTEWADSQGIGILIGACTSTRKAGGNLVLSHVTERIMNILRVTRLYLIFKTFDDDDAAAEYLLESSGELLLA